MKSKKKLYKTSKMIQICKDCGYDNEIDIVFGAMNEKEREKYYIYLYLGLKNGYNNHSPYDWLCNRELTPFTKIAKELNLSTHQVHRAYDSAMKKIEKYIKYKNNSLIQYI